VNLAQRLSALLDESPGDARERETSVFNRVVGSRRVVLIGAGNLGCRAVAAMNAAGAAPVAIADSDQRLHGTDVAGMRVLPVELAVQRFPDAAFVVTIWGARSPHRIAVSETRLRALGAYVIVPMAWLFWKYHTALPHYFLDLPHGILAQRGEVERGFGALSDGASRGVFVGQVEARLSGRIDRLGDPVAGEQYLAADLWRPRHDECVIDGGAFDGDTLLSWLRERGPAFASWLAIEPHPANVAALRATVATLPASVRERVRTESFALGAASGAMAMAASGVANAGATRSADDSGGSIRIGVSVRPLDDIVDDDQVSFVKLDIEGDELEALSGMRGVVSRSRPVLAVCAYHRQDHLWRVPLALAELLPEARIHLRPHGAEGWDLVAYAVPPHRAP